MHSWRRRLQKQSPLFYCAIHEFCLIPSNIAVQEAVDTRDCISTDVHEARVGDQSWLRSPGSCRGPRRSGSLAE